MPKNLACVCVCVCLCVYVCVWGCVFVTSVYVNEEESLPLGAYENKQRELKLERQTEYHQLVQQKATAVLAASTPRKGNL